MKRPLLASVSSFTLAAALAAQAAPARPLPSALPRSTYAMVQFGGLAACRDAAVQLPLAAVVTDFLQRLPAATREEHVDANLDRAGSELQRVLQRIGISPSDLRALLRRPMSFGVGRLTIEGMGPSVALVIDSGDAADAIERCVSAIEERLRRTPAAGHVEIVEVEGVSMRLLQAKHGPTVFAGDIGGRFVVTNSRGYLAELIGVARGDGGLAADPTSPDLCAFLERPALASMFVNTASVCRMFDEHLPYEAVQLGDALGVGRLDGIWAGLLAGDGGRDVLHVALRGSEHGLVKALSARPANLDLAAVCSQNTVLFAASSLDIAGVLDAAKRVVAQLPSGLRESFEDDVMRGIDRELRQAGMTRQRLDAMLRAFGTDVAFALALEKGAVPKPELLLRVAVRDADVVANLLARLEERTAEHAGTVWKSRKVGDHEIRFCNVELPNGALQISPCYVLLGDAVLCGSDVGALVRALGQANDRESSLAAQEDFVAMAAEAQGCSGVVHVRLFRAAELGWRSVETLVYPAIDAHAEELGFDSEALPDTEAMVHALGTCTAFCRVGADGFTIEGRGQSSHAAAFAGLGLLVDEVLSRAGSRVF